MTRPIAHDFHLIVDHLNERAANDCNLIVDPRNENSPHIDQNSVMVREENDTIPILSWYGSACTNFGNLGEDRRCRIEGHQSVHVRRTLMQDKITIRCRARYGNLSSSSAHDSLSRVNDPENDNFNKVFIEKKVVRL